MINIVLDEEGCKDGIEVFQTQSAGDSPIDNKNEEELSYALIKE